MSPTRPTTSNTPRKSKKKAGKKTNGAVNGQAKAQLAECVCQTTRQYLDDMGNTPPDNLHALMLSEVERALIDTVLARTEGNQSRTADILGITRATLRTRLQRYGLADSLSND